MTMEAIEVMHKGEKLSDLLTSGVPEEEVSPMMQHYLLMKKNYPDCILFYRLGDFYEMFFEDAVTVSRELELTLTGKSCGLEQRAPMCGVPFHAAESYLTRLVQRGYKVAICEQLEDPKQAKGIVKRDVIRVVTPGTTLNMQSLEETKNNYIMCVFFHSPASGIAVCDVTTGDFHLTEVRSVQEIRDEIAKFQPSELICNVSFLSDGISETELKEKYETTVYPLDPLDFGAESCRRSLTDHFHTSSTIGLGIEDFPNGTLAAGALLGYLKRVQKTELANLTQLHPYVASHYMLLDSATRRNLELTETLRDKKKRGTLLWVLDKTKTAMGARLLRSFVEQPLIDTAQMEERLSAVSFFKEQALCREEIREYLTGVYDLERLLARISYRTAGPRDMVAFGNSLRLLPGIKTALKDAEFCPAMERLGKALDVLEDIEELIASALVEEPPLSPREGGMIRKGYHQEVDHFREVAMNGKQWLADLEEETRTRTGIKNLRIKFSNNFGYSFEVTNSQKELVPDDFIRRQTLTNCERFTTPKLKELEDEILNAQEKLHAMEYEIFCNLRERVGGETERIQKTAKAVAHLDVYASLAYVAEHNRYIKPEIATDGLLDIREGRHPVVERMMETCESFIDNDTLLDQNKNAVSIITGPNMAGKSTYMRQTALIVLMAQIGSFVPAKSAHIGITDRIFTRVGASDDLGSGQSTFMVEMNEVANILRNATPSSLLILDEIGRGTSTYDGLSIAWAVVEHIANRNYLGARTLFATHYHELTELEGKIDNVNNYCIAVKERGDQIVFLRKIIRGGADKSYGIQVAKLAGVPDLVIDRAKEIANKLSENDIAQTIKKIKVKTQSSSKKVKHYDEVDLNQMSFSDTVKDAEVIRELQEMDVTAMTPIEALNTLYKLQNDLRNRI